jgi:branched-subunit amino acid ABC-type transport system permease component
MAESVGSLKLSFIFAILAIYAMLAIPFKSYAIGIKIRACREVSRIIGIRPPNVVRVVNIMGRKRCMAAVLKR